MTKSEHKKLRLQPYNTADVGTNTDKQLKEYKIFVFDLDNTLVLHKANASIREKYHKRIKNFLTYLKDNDKLIYIATHNFYPNSLLTSIDIPPLWFNGIIKETKDVNPCLNCIEDYTNKKHMILEILNKHKELSNDDVIFFDDHIHNIKQVENIDVKSIHVDENIGINFNEIY